MQLNLPILDQLQGRRSILIAGMGGGFDIFCGLPIFLQLRQLGMNVHLANFSFSDLEAASNLHYLGDTVYGVPSLPHEPEFVPSHSPIDATQVALFQRYSPFIYFPELYLAEWFRQTYGEPLTVWAFLRSGVKPLLDSYRRLVQHLSIDAIILIDGGVDALVQGDEAELGTLVEDSISLAAVNQLHEVPTKIVACIGLGAERDMHYPHIFQNIATLAEAEILLGTCSLVKQMPVYQAYAAAVHWAQSRIYQDPSVINSSIISAVEGYFGDYHLTSKTEGSKLDINPLMSIYWFFDLVGLAEQHLLLEPLLETEQLREVVQWVHTLRANLPIRPRLR